MAGACPGPCGLGTHGSLRLRRGSSPRAGAHDGFAGGADTAGERQPARPGRGQPRSGRWKLWTDDDHDCQDTRNEVLIAESEIPVTFKDRRKCKVMRGRWTCAYTGVVITDPRRLDVDHFVPLGNAARSGGQAWDSARKRSYANDLVDPGQLIAVIASANRAKGDRGPERWLPPDPAYRCTYLHQWFAVKKRWHLGVSPGERATLTAGLAACGARGAVLASPPPSSEAPPLPRSAPGPRAGLALPRGARAKPATRRACSKACKRGCPCGDACIPCSRTCKKPPGSACSSRGR
jgi:hypothetical protein